ncbi:MAG: hypothetical protein ACLQDY_20855 [Streptosporangiaceae bacterium]
MSRVLADQGPALLVILLTAGLALMLAAVIRTPSSVLAGHPDQDPPGPAAGPGGSAVREPDAGESDTWEPIAREPATRRPAAPEAAAVFGPDRAGSGLRRAAARAAEADHRLLRAESSPEYTGRHGGQGSASRPPWPPAPRPPGTQ